MGHTFDLIVNGLLDAKSRRPLPYLQVMSVGKTEPLKVQWLGAFNHPLEEPAIRIKFDDAIDPMEATPERIRVEPAVEKMKLLASSDEIQITGEFDLKQRYKVTISPELKGDRGYGLQSESRWGATFRPKEACLIFPSTTSVCPRAPGGALRLFPGQHATGHMETRAHSRGETVGSHRAREGI